MSSHRVAERWKPEGQASSKGCFTRQKEKASHTANKREKGAGAPTKRATKNAHRKGRGGVGGGWRFTLHEIGPKGDVTQTLNSFFQLGIDGSTMVCLQSLVWDVVVTGEMWDVVVAGETLCHQDELV